MHAAVSVACMRSFCPFTSNKSFEDLDDCVTAMLLCEDPPCVSILPVHLTRHGRSVTEAPSSLAAVLSCWAVSEVCKGREMQDGGEYGLQGHMCDVCIRSRSRSWENVGDWVSKQYPEYIETLTHFSTDHLLCRPINAVGRRLSRTSSRLPPPPPPPLCTLAVVTY